MIKLVIIICLFISILVISTKLVITKLQYTKFKHNKIYIYPVYQDEMKFEQIINFKNLEKLVINYNNQTFKSDSTCNCKLQIKSLNLYNRLKNQPFYNDNWLEDNTYKILNVKIAKDDTGGVANMKTFFQMKLDRMTVIERNILMMGNNDYIYKELDISGCGTSIAYYFCKVIGIKHDYLSKYFQEKTQIRTDVMKHYNLNYNETKKFIIAYLHNTSTLSKTYNSVVKDKGNAPEDLKFLVGLKSEIKELKKNIYSYLVKYPKWRLFLENTIKKYIKTVPNQWKCDFKKEITPILTDSNIINTYLLNGNICKLFDTVMMSCQNSIIINIYNYLVNNNYSVDCIIHDACLIRNNKGTNHDWNKLKDDISNDIKNNLKIDIKLQYRNWHDEKIHPLYNNTQKCEHLSKKDDNKYLCDLCCRENN